MAPPLAISVIGSSTLYRKAEAGVLNATVTATSLSQEEVSGDVIKTCNKLRSLFVGLAPKDGEGYATADAPVTRFTMGGVTTSSQCPLDNNRKRLEIEYTATAAFIAVFRDFDKLGETISDLFRTPHVRLSPTGWRLTEATNKSLGAESRRLAMQDAIKKAQDYAGVLDRMPMAIEVSDSNLPDYRGVSHETMACSYSRSSGVHLEGMTLEPEDVKVTTQVHVKFQAD
ncbi:MAG: hypothetical protein Q9216_002859 [Gyalolechia sp. 2 TL-2023]